MDCRERYSAAPGPTPEAKNDALPFLERPATLALCTAMLSFALGTNAVTLVPPPSRGSTESVPRRQKQGRRKKLGLTYCPPLKRNAENARI